MTGEVRIGLAGCGRLAEVGYLPALRRARGVRLCAVAEPDADRRAQLDGGVPAHRSVGALLAEEEVDALVLATPAAAHLGDAALAAAAGMGVLVEKPPAPDLVGACALAKLRPQPYLGFNRRFGPGVTGLREQLAEAGRFELRLDLHYRRRAWRPHTVGDDALLDLGPHLVDLALFLSGGEVRVVRARALDFERAELELELTRGRAVLSCAIDRPHRERIEVLDESGQVLVRQRAGGVRSAIGSRLRRDEHPLVASLTGQLEAFADAVRTGSGGALATAAEGIAPMAVIEAARRSAAAGGDPCLPDPAALAPC